MSGNLTQVIATADQQAASTQPTASIVKIVDSPSGDPKEGRCRWKQLGQVGLLCQTASALVLNIE